METDSDIFNGKDSIGMDGKDVSTTNPDAPCAVWPFTIGD